METLLVHMKWVVNNKHMFCESIDYMVERKCLFSCVGVREGLMEVVGLNLGPEEWVELDMQLEKQSFHTRASSMCETMEGVMEQCGYFFHFHDQSLGSLSWGVMTSCFLFPKCHGWIGKSRNWWGCRNLEHLERGLRPFFLDWEILQGGTCSTKQKHPSGWFLGVSSSLLSIWKINSQPQRRKYKDLLV